MDLIAVKIGRDVKPGPRHLVGNIHLKSVAVPPAARIAHKQMDLRINMRTAIERHYSKGMHLLPNEDHGAGRLQDLIAKLSVAQVRESRGIAMSVGLFNQVVAGKVDLLLSRPWLIGNFPVRGIDNETGSRRDRLLLSFAGLLNRIHPYPAARIPVTCEVRGSIRQTTDGTWRRMLFATGLLAGRYRWGKRDRQPNY